jgi:methionyl-tRNA formyltransferase
MIKVVPIGGTERAYNTMLNLFNREDIEIPFVIIMPGDEREKVFASKLSDLCLKHKTEFFITFKITEEILERVENCHLDLILGVGVWRSLVDERFFEASRYGYLGLHGTKLPYYRGFAGINWQVINGSKEIEMSVFRVSSGVDNGPLVANKDR